MNGGAVALLSPVCAWLLSPLLLGMILRVKAAFAGRTGPPVLQPYFDLAKLLRKGSVFSRTAGPIFRLGPGVGLASLLAASLVVPLPGLPAPISFEGDFVLMAYLLALGRFAAMLAALDTGSSFEGMGASREAWYGALAEPALFLSLAVLSRDAGSGALAGILSPAAWARGPVVPVLCAAALFVVYLAENARIPFDDPATHLELTMVHEAMALDHAGPDLAAIEYARALKLWVLGALLAGLVPLPDSAPALAAAGGLAALAAVALATGVLESSVARLRLPRTSNLLLSATALAAVAAVLALR